MASLAPHFLEMARNNAWPNHRLHVACARLDDAELKADRSGFFGSIHRMLSHILYSEARTDATLDASVELEREAGARHPERVASVLAHPFQHQVHHRGQVHAMLSGTRIPPPQLDEYFLAEDADRRAGELQALGLPVR